MKLTCVQFMSREDAEKIIPGHSYAMISIAVPDGIQPSLHTAWTRQNLLRLYFHDADADASHVPGGKLQLFSNQHAKQIIDFVDEIKNNAVCLFVHCDAGISRSSAVAKAICEINKLEFDDRYQLYNKYVYRTIMNFVHTNPFGGYHEN